MAATERSHELKGSKFSAGGSVEAIERGRQAASFDGQSRKGVSALVAARRKEGDAEEPLNDGEDRQAAQQREDREAGPLDPTQARVKDTQKTPWDKCCAGEPQSQSGRIRAERLDELAAHEKREARRHAATRAGDSE